MNTKSLVGATSSSAGADTDTFPCSCVEKRDLNMRARTVLISAFRGGVMPLCSPLLQEAPAPFRQRLIRRPSR